MSTDDFPEVAIISQNLGKIEGKKNSKFFQFR